MIKFTSAEHELAALTYKETRKAPDANSTLLFMYKHVHGLWHQVMPMRYALPNRTLGGNSLGSGQEYFTLFNWSRAESMVYNFGGPWKCEAEVNSVTTSAFTE
jgi:hypothetical protein